MAINQKQATIEFVERWKAEEEAYGVDLDVDEEKIVSHLFKLYAEATKEQ